jgi:CRP-like cAMP-binding protein
MAEVTTKPRSVAKTPTTNLLGIPAARFASVVDRTTELSDGVLKSLEANERAAIEAVGQFVITIEEALPQEVAGTSDVAKKITQSGLEMVDRLVHNEYDFLRTVIDSAGKSLNLRDGAKHQVA